MKTYIVTIQEPRDGVAGLITREYAVEAQTKASAKTKALKLTGLPVSNPDLEVLRVEEIVNN